MQSRRDTTAALTFAGLQALVIVRNLGSGFFSFFWYCDFTPGLLAVMFALRNVQAVKGILNVGLFAQIGYLLIVLVKLLFGITLFDFVFDFPFTAQYVVPTLIIHTSTLIAFALTYREKPSKDALIYSLLLLAGMYAVVLLFAEPTKEIGFDYNFIFYAHMFSSLPYYTTLWVPLTFLFVAVPTHTFQYLAYVLFTAKMNLRNEPPRRRHSDRCRAKRLIDTYRNTIL